MNKVTLTALCVLSACASSPDVPDAFTYKTSLRGEQGWAGAKTRKTQTQTLLSAGVVSDPMPRLEAAFPNAEIELRRYGLSYAKKDWSRYHAVLDVDIKQDGRTTKCKAISPEVIDDMPTLADILAEGGAALEADLQRLTESCIAEVNAAATP